MNETLKVLEERRSCRNFIPDKMIPKEDLDAILKAGTYAATGMGKQTHSPLRTPESPHGPEWATRSTELRSS